MASTYLTRTVTSAGNRKTWTFSCWVKRCTTSANTVGYDSIFSTNISNEGINIAFGNGAFTNVGDYFEVTHAAASGGGTTDWSVRTNQLFRDISGWYHLVVAFDTTQSTTADRVKIYVNGVEVDKTVTTGPALNTDYEINNTQQHTIGRWQRDGNSYFDGNLGHFHFCDGTAYQASDFGETDSTTGIWKPKTSPSVTYGTNGFFLKFENSAAMGTDSSGNSNTWAVSGGTLTQTQDTPTNVFATWNPLDKDGVASLTNGNLTFTSNPSGGSSNCNMGMYAGKWYFEVKHTQVNNCWLGIVPQNLYKFGSDLFPANYTTGIYAGNPNLYLNGVSQGSLGGGLTTNDIIMYAVDMDNNQIYIGKNGNWNDGLGGGFDQADFSNATAYSFNRYDDFYVLASVNGSGSTGYTFQTNFGNGYFGTTAVSSGNADGDGYGVFEYAPPTGYYALCTKNIASYG